jgi:hypothetical protein
MRQVFWGSSLPLIFLVLRVLTQNPSIAQLERRDSGDHSRGHSRNQ